MKLIPIGYSFGYKLNWSALCAAGLMFYCIAPRSARAQVYNRPTYSSPVAVSRDDKLIWAVNPADDSVSVFRPDLNTRIAKIAVGDEPQSVALTPDGQYAWVANAAAGTVTASVTFTSGSFSIVRCEHSACSVAMTARALVSAAATTNPASNRVRMMAMIRENNSQLSTLKFQVSALRVES